VLVYVVLFLLLFTSNFLCNCTGTAYRCQEKLSGIGGGIGGGCRESGGGAHDSYLQQPGTVARELAVALYSASSEVLLQAIIANATMTTQEGSRRSMSFPLFHRAFPTHRYGQVLHITILY
jgi:hypothetical protein